MKRSPVRIRQAAPDGHLKVFLLYLSEHESYFRFHTVLDLKTRLLTRLRGFQYSLGSIQTQ